MIQTGFETRVKVQDIIQSQLPEFILQESPLTSDFLKQYYTSQEYQSGPVDIAENLDQYLKLDNLTPEVVVDNTYLSVGITSTDSTIIVNNTKGYPQSYGLLKIDDEIITYTGITTNSFTGCIRGFSGITSYHNSSDPEELVFSTSNQSSHTANSSVSNLSVLFLKEFYKKFKYTFTPGLENSDFNSNLNIGNFIKSAKSFYQSKGTKESFRILFNVLYGVTPTVVNLSDSLIRPSSAEYLRTEEIVVEVISGNANKLIGQTITKSDDPNTYASVSQAEPFTINQKLYYKISLFVGYNDTSAIVGTFTIPGKTKVIEQTLPGSSVITVDTTIGFPQSGNLICGINSITYTNKSVNQFYGCSGITATINPTDDIRVNETVFGYEDGDITKPVYLRITGVISDFTSLLNNYSIDEGDIISVDYLGEIIKNSTTNNSYKEIFANSWIYNTSSRYQVNAIGNNGSTFTLSSPIDKSSLKIGDKIDILIKGTQTIVSSTSNPPSISAINVNNNQVNISNIGFTPSSNVNYDIRRRLNKASSSGTPIGFGNSITSDIQNLYVDDGTNYAYVAANGLPSYNINQNLISASIPSASGNYIQNQNSFNNLYSVISFSNPVPFITGDWVYYYPSSTLIPGLTQGNYYVEVLSNKNQIRLYTSRSFIGSGGNYVEFGNLSSGSGAQNFLLNTNSNNTYISPQLLLKKFPLTQNIQSGLGQKTNPGSIGILINGVEIQNYKSNDKIYYGPLNSIKVLNGGSNYDVINPPQLSVSSGAGTTALVQPVVSGFLSKIFVTPQNFDLNTVVSVALTGGNGSGSILTPVIQKRRREILFDARLLTNFYGGVDTTNETITFLSNHNLNTGDSVIYDSNGNSPIGIATAGGGGSNSDQNLYLSQNATYYISPVNNTTIKLYNSKSDAINGTNSISFTNVNNTGNHKFKSGTIQNTLTEIKILDGGKNYTNRKLIVKSSGISTVNDTIYFSNHGFNDGDLVVYNYQTSAISGLNTTNQYYISKVDNNYFKLCDAGIGGTNITNYIRNNTIDFGGTGSGYQYFSYPPISLVVTSATVGVGTTSIKYASGIVTATPIVKGSIIDAYLYETGSDYGSTVLNLEKKPLVSILNGKDARLSPVILDGKITDVNVLYGGSNYYSTPDIIVNGSGTGAVIQPIINNGLITDAVVVNSGLGYTSTNTSITVVSSGSNASFDVSIRSLTVNNKFKYNSDEVINSTNNGLQYSVFGYSSGIRTAFSDTDKTKHSPIIGWAYDGNPIYGAFGYSDPQNTSSTIKILNTGYDINTSLVINRPSGFSAGFFVEDYTFNNSGDLDESNGRFAKTPEFPNGVYAYFAGITTDPSLSSNLISDFPYFIGNTYASNYITDNSIIDQTFDFNNSTLVRNTFPYKLNYQYATNDFIIESSDSVNQQSIVESVSEGSIDDFDILYGGQNYQVGDRIQFDNSGTNGTGASASVDSIIGIDINNIQTNIQTYNNSVLTWKDGNQVQVNVYPYHNFLNGDNVVISGLSTSLAGLNGLYNIGVTTYYAVTTQYIPTNPSSGVVTDIYVSSIPNNLSIGSSISIGNEFLSVVNIFNPQNVIRVNRGVSGTAYTNSTLIEYIPDSFVFTKKSNYFDSKLNYQVFFNPKESVGYGVSAGVSSSTTFAFAGITSYSRSIPSQSIYIENHQFSNNQQVILSLPDITYSPLSISTSFGSTPFNLPISGISTIVYVTNKSRNTIGIKTTLNSSEVFFVGLGLTSDSYFYSLETTYNQVTATAQKIQTTVSTASTHNLSNNDSIQLVVKPNLSVGIGTSTSVYVKYDPIFQKVIINPIGFSSVGINTLNSTIYIPSHNLNTGNKIIYSAQDLLASGLSTTTYFTYKVDNDHIQLCKTYYDSQIVPPTIVSIASTGGALQKINPINPQIQTIKDNNLVFNLSDSSLIGYNLRIYFDSNFNNELVSTGTTSNFNVSRNGIVGVTTDASLTINYTSDLPNILYYTLENSGFISTSDTSFQNTSQILFSDSVYNGDYIISGIGTTTFNISLSNVPENLYYNQSQTDVLKYSTKSLIASGPINKIKLISGGVNYKKLPIITGFASSIGNGALINPKSKTIGIIKNISVLNEGFEYSSDKTLKPTANIAQNLTLTSFDTISSIEVVSGGKNYQYAPNLILIDSISRNQIDNGFLKANLSGNSINSVDIVDSPKGLSRSGNTIISTNNSNGLSINNVYSSASGIVTCVLTTPILGFSTYYNPVVSIGDSIFVEGIQKYSDDGTGFNSADYGYNFFTVTNASTAGANPFQFEYNLSNLTSNPGIAKTSQDSLASAIKYDSYPQFNVIQKSSAFKSGEKLLININGSFIEQNLTVVSNKNQNQNLTVSGKYQYDLFVGAIIKGKESGTIATIQTIAENYGRFIVNYSTKKDFGWKNEIGKLNKDSQVIENSDYYQDLSYTIKSPIQFNELISPVNNLLHTSGLKNFADVGITSGAQGISTGITSSIVLYDIIDQNRVDTINNFDIVTDYNIINNSSNFVKFKNKSLQSYITCNTNRVLEIDDISSQFSSLGLSASDQNKIIEITSQDYNRFLVQIIDTNRSQFQLTELITLNDITINNIFELEKGSIYNTKVTDLSVYTEPSTKKSYLYLNLVNPYDYDYDIKILQNNFYSGIIGIGSTSIGFISQVSTNNTVASTASTSFVSVSAASTTSIFSNIQLIDTVTNLMNYVELYVTTDGNDTYFTEYYFDTSASLFGSYNPIGTFGASISSGILSLNFTNTGTNPVILKSKNIGFGSTSAGIGTYRFILPGQIEGSERTIKYQSDFSTVSTASSIVSVNRYDTSSIKSIVQVSVGSTNVLHQVMLIQDGNNTYVNQYPYLSIGSTTGIGTFGGSLDSSNNFSLVFYPDQSIGNNIKISAFSECLYTDIDTINVPPPLQYGSMIETVNTAQYSAANGNRIQRLDFDLNYQGTPIFQKTFNPTDSAVLNPVTGVFTIPNHFFSTGEPLNYTPGSTFIGIGSTSVGIGATLNVSGVVTTILPSVVYPIKIDSNSFKLSTRPDYASAGIYVTFTSYGLGNAHSLQMNKRLERSIISIDNIVQYPITYTSINYTLQNNGGTVSASSTTFALSGISSIKAGDLLRVDDEYMKILNVGIGTTNVGPITNSGSFSLVNVSRGSVGSSLTTHTDSTIARIYRGSFNIVGKQIHFIDPPIGTLLNSVTPENLPQPKSSFEGRVYLKQDYSTNTLFDDISYKFTGIGQTYTLTTQGINTVGLGSTGNGIVFINNIFQTPTTANNVGNDYSIISNNSVGITSIIFSGVSSNNGSLITSIYDINQNRLPRGGVIVSLGSSGGLGYAPLVGAAVSATIDANGTITSIGIGTTGLTYGSGYFGNVSIGVTDPTHVGNNYASITATVGVGGTLIFNIGAGGTGYKNPVLQIPSPSYSNMPVIGVSRVGLGTTTTTGVGLLLNVNVSASSTTGIGSTLFQVDSFQITRNGYAFQKGDVFTPVGLVTDSRLSSPLSQFQLTVIDTFSDSFSAWNFGELDYIDSIANLQDGSRTRFPLYYNGSLLSFQTNINNIDSLNIDLNSLLLIFVNGVIQKPNDSYQFNGGSSFTFTEPPLPQDNISIFFYRGTRGVDSDLKTVYQTIKTGDTIQIFSNNNILGITTTQNQRTVYDIPSSDKIQTNIYSDIGIDPTNLKPLSWTKQKVDSQISEQLIYKSRDSIESLVYPTAKIIKNFSSTDTQIFVDDANFFKYEQNLNSSITGLSVDGLIVNGSKDPVAAAVTAIVSSNGTISSLSIVSAGSGYTGNSITVKISKPKTIGIGIGTTATATISVSSSGSLTTPITITNSGFGYTTPPQVITPLPTTSKEYISGITNISGFSGIITGIGTTSGTSGNPLALKFYLNSSGDFSQLSVGYPIYVYNTSVGKGVTSIDSNDTACVGIGTSHLDNIYYIHAISYTGAGNTIGIVTSNILSTTSVTGIATNGNYVGQFSWGKLSGFSRSSSPVSIAVTGFTIDSGLSTFASIQRRSYGIRDTGALKYTNIF